jgi:hypothetical protein
MESLYTEVRMRECWLLVLALAVARGLIGPPAAAASEPSRAVDQEQAPPVTSSRLASSRVERLAVSFKMDPRLATGTYGGDRWVAPSRYARVGDEKGCVVEARVQGLGASGRPSPIRDVSWTSANPEIAGITPGDGTHATISVVRDGETTIRVTSQGLAKILTIKAVQLNGVLHVEIGQK